MKYKFKAKSDAGLVKEGYIEALSPEAASQILGKNGLIPLSIREEKEVSVALKSFERMWNGVSQKELMVFFQQMATLIEARVPIVSSLLTIAEQSENRYFRLIVKEMSDNIDDGMPLSEAMEKHPDVFSPLVVSMIKAGEISGGLQQSIAFVAENIEKNYVLTAKIRGALYYPAFVLFVAFIIGFLVVSFILPKITVLIKDLKVAVPWYTSVLMWLGDFMSTYWWAVLLAILGGVFALFYYIRTASGKHELESIILKIPVIGNLARNIYITRFSENLAALLNGGIPVVNALIIVSDIIGNHVFEKTIMRAAEEVKAGGTMSTVLMRSSEIPTIVAQIVRIGEETGTISKVLQSMSKFYSQEVDNTTKSLTTLIEPFLIVLLGIGVGILVVGVLMPIYNIAGQL